MSSPWAVFFDHAAIAVREPDKLTRVLAILGLKDAGSEPVPSQGVNTHFYKPSESTPAVEILESVDPAGVIAKYLDKKGPGIHHLCFRVEPVSGGKTGASIEALCKKLKANGIRLVYPAPQPGAHGMKVNFIHPESTGGILIEVSEKAS